MKAVFSMGIRLPQIKVNIWFLLLYISIFMFLVFSILQIQFKCIKIGYEINNYAKKNRVLAIISQDLELKKNKYENTNYLYKKAKEMNLNFPEAKKVYYVK